MRWDYMVIGQGLAGSVLSYYFIKNGRKVLVIDDPSLEKSSLAAAGIYNPITGRKLVKTWMADKLFPYLKQFYSEMQEDLQAQLLHPLPMYRPFLSTQEQNEWGARTHQSGYQEYITQLISPDRAIPGIVNPLGGLLLTNCGYVDIPEMITGVSGFLSKRNCLMKERFEESEVELYSDHVVYRGISANRLIFCNGPSLRHSKFFGWLPLRPVKGEVLNIEMKVPLKFIVNRGVFVLPISQRICKVGSTFNNQDLSPEPTRSAKQQILEKLNRLVEIPYQVLGHTAGIRPASSDRRPLIGLHPEFEPLGVFNGLGTKGVSLTPFFVREFFDFLEHGRALVQDVAINRHFSLYYNKI